MVDTKDEIDLLVLFKTIWSNRKTVLKIGSIFFLIGLFIAVFSPKKYTAETIIIPQTQKSKTEGLGGLAAIAGINIGGASYSDIPPTLYPKVVSSIPFLKKLIIVPLKFSGIEKEVTFQEYYRNHQEFNLLRFIKKYTLGLPGVIIGFFKGEKDVVLKTETYEDKIYRISKEDNELFNLIIKEQLKIISNDKEGYVKISFSMPEAEPAAKMLQKSQELLQSFITDFKINKAKEELKFVEDRLDEAKADFSKKQIKLASFRDRNVGLITSRSQTHLERLKSDYDIAYGVYSELAKKLESQKIKVKESTPIFTVIQPVSVPLKKSEPRRIVIIVLWSFLGLILGVGLVFVQSWIKKNKI